MSAAPASISVIVPVHNGARFLSEALRSVKSQTLPVDEIIVVDDSSSDVVEDIVRREHPDVVLIRQLSASAAAARNAGRGARVAKRSRSSIMMISGCRDSAPPCSTPGEEIPRPMSSAPRSACWSSPEQVTTSGSGARKVAMRRSWSARL
jgi:hypothetical protein